MLPYKLQITFLLLPTVAVASWYGGKPCRYNEIVNYKMDYGPMFFPNIRKLLSHTFFFLIQSIICFRRNKKQMDYRMKTPWLVSVFCDTKTAKNTSCSQDKLVNAEVHWRFSAQMSDNVSLCAKALGCNKLICTLLIVRLVWQSYGRCESSLQYFLMQVLKFFAL